MMTLSSERTAAFRAVPEPTAASSLSATQVSDSANIVFMATSGPETDWFEPTARNSKRLPVNANGDVRLRSPGSLGHDGSEWTPRFILICAFGPVNEPL